MAAETPSAPTSFSRFKLNREQLIYAILIAIPVIYVTAFMVYPSILSVYYSFSHPRGGPIPNTLAYTQNFNDPLFTDALGNNLLIVVITVPLELLAGLLLALLLSRRFFGRGFLRAILVLPIAIPEIVFLLGMMFLFREKGIINTILFSLGLPHDILWLLSSPLNYITVVMVEVWRTMPLCALLLLAGLQSIPTEVYEAASIDGAGRWMTFRRVTLPLLMPAIFATVLLRGIDALKIFATTYVLTDIPVLSSYAYWIYVERWGFKFIGLSRATATANILALIIIAFSYVFIRYTSR